MSKLIKFLYTQSYKPGILGMFINPLYLLRRPLILHIKNLAPKLKGTLLDFGCGNKPYEHFFINANKYIGLDILTTGHDSRFVKADVYYDGKTIPFDNNSFDSIFCSEVLEHVFNIDEILQEMHRVLKPGGLMLVTLPFCWNEHEIPYDFGRYTSYGLKYVMKKNNFEELEFYKSGNFISVIYQLHLLYIYEVLKKFKIVGMLITFLFTFPLNITGSILNHILIKNDTFYFNNVILVKKSG